MTRRSRLAGLGAAIAAACTRSPLSKHANTIRAVVDAPSDPPLSADHAKLIRNFRVTWVPVESGAPGINAVAPFGPDDDVLRRALQLLGTRDGRLAAKAIAESGRMLPTYLANHH